MQSSPWPSRHELGVQTGPSLGLPSPAASLPGEPWQLQTRHRAWCCMPAPLRSCCTGSRMCAVLGCSMLVATPPLQMEPPLLLDTFLPQAGPSFAWQVS